MSAVYTIAMYQVHDLSGTGVDFGPPVGFAWIIKDVDAVNGEALNEVQLHGPAGQVIWANSFGGTVGFDYASYRGRAVLVFPDVAHVETTAAMDVSVYGYQLSLP